MTEGMTELDNAPEPARKVGFVLGGGGPLGAYEVGMLQALLEHGVTPDVVVGTSIGALNGAAIAYEPTIEMVEKLKDTWLTLGERHIFDSPLGRAANLVRQGTHLHSNVGLRRLIHRLLPVDRFEDLKVPFHCVAASIERAAEQWFSEGPLTDAILASAAVPGLLPPVEIKGEHYVDGGIVNSIPVDKAVQLGATELYILQVGRIEHPLEPPKTLLQVAMVAFEIARRHRFAREIAQMPAGVVSHLLPTGTESKDPIRTINARRFSKVAGQIEGAYLATKTYLAQADAQVDLRGEPDGAAGQVR
jgi:NTE family protein